MNTTTNPLVVTAPEGLPFIDFVREVDHPVERVFEAHRDPDLYRQWIGSGGDLDLKEFSFRTGGRYRFVQRGQDGVEYAFNGVFHVVRDNEFAIQTFEFEALPDVVSVESLRFERLDGDRTRLIGHAVYPSLEARDGMVSSGMQDGMEAGYAKLDRLLAGE